MRRRSFSKLAFAVLVSCGPGTAARFPAIADVPFLQESRIEVPSPSVEGAQSVRAMAVSADGVVWIASKAGVFRWADGAWTQLTVGPAFAVSARGASVWAGTWNGLYRLTAGAATRDPEVTEPIVALWTDSDGVIAAGQNTLFENRSDAWTRTAWTGSKAIRSIARDPSGGLWVATGMGAYYRKNGKLTELFKERELLSGELRATAIAPNGDAWLGSNGGVDVYRQGRRIAWFNASRGMPNQDVRCLAIEPDGRVWMGTALGAVRRAGQVWSLRHSRRWLPSDEVLSIAIGPDHTVWIATTAGLSAIRQRPMTLAEKADVYLKACLARHVRPPYLVEQCDLKTPGDLATFTPRDDDNEGGYTAEYMAMESYRYAVTGNPAARENAHAAFRALEFLQTVTGTSGFFARTVVPSDWTKLHDPNQKFTAEELVDRTVQNPRDKPVENRWRTSADGKWLWKGDTSSDEVSAHMFGYLTYYNLAADEADRSAIRDLVRRIVDHIVEGGYTFQDIDGKPTLWGVWSPEKLNHDPDWRAERWTNGLEILAYLRIAEDLTGDRKYRTHYLDLIDRQHYGEMARRPLGTEPSERTHFDQELAAFVFPGVMLEKDPRLRLLYREGLEFWRKRIAPEYSAFFAFTWASLVPAGTPDLVSLAKCVEFLRDEPLDLVNWTVDNRRREDLRLVHEPLLDDLQLSRLLPPSERATMRTDANPWSAVRGEDGKSESSGVHWLLPYWMGRYYGYIETPHPR